MTVRVKNSSHDIAYIEVSNDSRRGTMNCFAKVDCKMDDRQMTTCLNLSSKLLEKHIPVPEKLLQQPLVTIPYPKDDSTGGSGGNENNTRRLSFIPTAEPCSDGWQGIQTVVVKNIPHEINQQMFVNHLIAIGFGGTYDYVHVPLNCRTKLNRGYAFVNFKSTSNAWQYKTCVDGISTVSTEKEKGKRWKVTPATMQGLEAIHAHHTALQMERGDSALNTQPGNGPWFLSTPPAKLGLAELVAESPIANNNKSSIANKPPGLGIFPPGLEPIELNVCPSSPIKQKDLSNQEGPKLSWGCVKCERTALPRFKFCTYCGTALTQVPEFN